jgi:hypothetical protein
VTPSRAVTRSDYPGNEGQWRASIERRLEKLFTLITTQPVKEVAEGSDLSVRGVLKLIGSLDLTGTMSLKSATGNELMRLGEMIFGRGLEITRDDGTVAFRFRKLFDTSTKQAWVLCDSAGHSVVEEAAFGPGLSRPYLEHPFQPVAATSGSPVTCGPHGFERTVSSGSWTTIFEYDGKAQNAFLDLKFWVICSDGSTAGELQIIDLATGTPLSGFVLPAWLQTIPAGTVTLTAFDPTPDQIILIGFPIGGTMRLGIQGRRTAGSGSITVSLAQAMGG